MIEEYLDLVAVLAMAAVALAAFFGLRYASSPQVCKAAEIALSNPGSELLVWGRFRYSADSRYIYLSCGLAVPRSSVLAIERTEGLLTIGSTADGLLYIR
jgi:predicted component of type VI protein secretion system